MVSIELFELLLAVAEERQDLNLAQMEEATVRWAIKTGAGPLLLQHADTRGGTETNVRHLKGADLVGRLVVEETKETMVEILTACQKRFRPFTLLKGVSIRDQHYPAPHLRPMRDLDILVEAKDVPAVERVLTRMGFQRPGSVEASFYEQHHHSKPLFDPQHGVWVEIHRGLFPPKSLPGKERVFGPENVRQQRRLTDFYGHEVSRLSDELQLVYISAHWAYDFRPVGAVVALFDILYLLRQTHNVLKWERIFEWLRYSPGSRRAVCLMLTYLARLQLHTLPEDVCETLESMGRQWGRTDIAVLHRIIDLFFVNGRSFRGMVSLRNVDILWRTLLGPGSQVQKLMLIPLMLLLPWGIRSRLLEY